MRVSLFFFAGIRLPPQREGDKGEADDAKRKKLTVQLSTGARDVGKVKSALMFATLAQYCGCDTVISCVQEGADVLVKGAIREEGLPPGGPGLRAAHERGPRGRVRFRLCEQAANKKPY